MQVISADASWKNKILEILDDFREFCTKADNPRSTLVTNTATLYGSEMFDSLLLDPKYKIFIAIEEDAVIGIITGFILPQLRKGQYGIEIEEFFVREEYHGKGVAKMLMENIENWGRIHGANTIRLESGYSHKRGHSFYLKSGFIEYGKAFQKRL